MKSPTLDQPLAATLGDAAVRQQDTTTGFLDGLLRRNLLRRLNALRHGQLTLVDTDGGRWVFGDLQATLRAEVHVHAPALWRMLAARGAIGAGEAYVLGHWSSPDLTSVMRVLVANLDVLDGLERGPVRLGKPLLQGLHWLNRNTRDGSRRNIAAHYDLGNALFERFLDPSMMYSAAVFDAAHDTLALAQRNKLARICRKLELKPTDHLLEIGTGWGGMAIHAAQRHGCRVTTTTLSKEQYDTACARVAAAGLQDRVTVLLEDYRDLSGQYDKLVSIEMIEAVGHRYLPTYFHQCASLLKPDGLMLLQAITIRDQRYARARRSVDFIQKYIFPGGALPSVSRMADVVASATDMTIHHMEDIGLHYARTLRLWRENLRHAREELAPLGYDERFFRMWQYYFCYCEGGFMERHIGTAQLLLAKPGARPVYPGAFAEA
ncbi:Cyclopropane-fatty-acyl-phospholipid synthase, plant type [plant metagenome]|uniref:Cyclopropane-fatty-acyl-phospholipid synthase, plant type n=1 Tax=plant metagenome TaxID=1297885 RepID=A0A484QKB8_9ZZZZ